MKIAIYCRVSTDSQEAQNTIDSQIADLEALAKEDSNIIVDKYIDNGYSGTILARPDLDRLRDDALKGLFEAVFIHSPDRLARKYVYQELVIEELKNRGIKVIFKNRKIAETPEDQLLLGVQGIVAEYERAKIIERTRRGRLHRAKTNHIIGNIPPYGYKCIKKVISDTGYARYEIYEEEAKNVRLMFNLLVDRQMTTYGIIRELNNKRIIPRKSSRWARSSVNKILNNETYAGTTYYNKHYGVATNSVDYKGEGKKYHRRKNNSTRLRAKDEWIAIKDIPQIISRGIWNKAIEQLKLNSKLSNRNTKNKYLLKGLLKCGYDNKSLYGIPMHGKTCYRCANKSKLNSDFGCPTPSISASIIEPFVWNTVSDLLNNPKLIKKQLDKWLLNKKSEAVQSENKLKNIQNNILKLKNEENRIMLAYSSGALTLEQFKEQNLRIIKENENIESDKKILEKLSLNSIENTSIGKSKYNILLKQFKYLLKDLNFDKKQRILRTIIKEIELKDHKVYIRGYLPPRLNVQLRTQPPKVMDTILPKFEFEIVKKLPKGINQYMRVYF